VEQDLATPIQSQECLKAFTIEEIKYEITVKQKKKRHLITARMLKELPKEGFVKIMYIFSALL
jgi:hypothetical protein